MNFKGFIERKIKSADFIIAWVMLFFALIVVFCSFATSKKQQTEKVPEETTKSEETKEVEKKETVCTTFEKEPEKEPEKEVFVRPETILLDVKNIMQEPELENGCEVVSLAIVLQYYGFSIDPGLLYDVFMPKSPYPDGNPWETYVGNARDWDGLGCYAPCIVKTGNSFLAYCDSEKKVKNISGKGLSFYKDIVAGGDPVIMWGTLNMNGNDEICWEEEIDGDTVVWHSYSHCMVMIGYTEDTCIFCDPLEGICEYENEDVLRSFNISFRQACMIK